MSRATSDASATSFLEAVVRTPSPPGGERAVAELLVGRAEGSAVAARIDDAGNAVAVFGNGPLRVTFLGHMDTVPGAVPVRRELMDHPPGLPGACGVALYGRGAVDAKGSLCAALFAALRAGPGVLDAITFTFVAAVEEETEGSRGARHALATLEPPDMLLIGEPSGWQRYTLGYKGRLGVKLTAEVDAQHSSREEPTAAELIMDAAREMRAYAASLAAGGPFYRLQFTLESIESRNDGLSDRCAARASLRLPPGIDAAQLADSLAARAAEAGVHAEFTGGVNAHRSDARSELARAFRVAIRAAGGKPTPTLKTGTSDMNVVAPTWNVPMLAYGPGDSNLDHRPNEHLPLAEYLASIRVIERALLVLAGEGR